MDQVPFRVAFFRPEDLVQIREADSLFGRAPRFRNRVRVRVRLRAGGGRVHGNAGHASIFGGLRLTGVPPHRHAAFVRALVVAEAQEDGLAQQAVVGDLEVAHLHHHLRLHPGVLLPIRCAPGGRPVPAVGVQTLLRLADLFLGEAGADAAGEHQLAVVVGGEVEGTEAGAAAAGTGVAHDDEVVGAVGAHLHPVPGSAAPISRVRLLGHDAFEAHALHLREQGLAALGDVLRVAQRARRRQHVVQQAFAFQQRQRPHVVALERQQVECVQRGRQAQRHAPDVQRTPELAPPLQPLEAGQATLVVHHHLPVQHDVVVGQRVQHRRQLRERVRQFVPVPAQQQRFPTLPRRDHAVTVVLQLEHPAVTRERRIAAVRQHHLHVPGPDGPARRIQVVQRFRHGRRPVHTGAHLLHRQARVDGALIEVRPRRMRSRIPLLDEQPVLVRLHAHQRPTPHQLRAAQLEQELPLFHALGRILQRHPRAPVPHDDGARTVVARGNHAFEVGILHRVVLHVRRETLVRRVVRRPLGHRPRFEHAVQLQPEVVVEVARRMLLHDERADGAHGARHRPGAALPGRPGLPTRAGDAFRYGLSRRVVGRHRATRRLRRALERTLVAIGTQGFRWGHEARIGHHAPFSHGQAPQSRPFCGRRVRRSFFSRFVIRMTTPEGGNDPRRGGVTRRSRAAESRGGVTRRSRRRA